MLQFHDLEFLCQNLFLLWDSPFIYENTEKLIEIDDKKLLSKLIHKG